MRLVTTKTKLLSHLAVLGAVRDPVGLPLFLKLFPAAIGFLHLTSLRFSGFVYLAFPFMFMANVAAIGAGTPPVLMLRLNFAFMLVFFASFVAQMDQKQVVDSLVKVLLPVIVITAVFEMLLGPTNSRTLNSLLPDFGLPLIYIPRMRGINGGSNFSAMISGVMSLIFIYHGRRGPAVISTIVMLLFLSRTGTLAFLVAWGVMVSPVVIRAAAVIASSAVFILIPWIVLISQQILSPAEKFYLILLTSSRYLHWTNFVNFGLDNPIFGVGYFKGMEYYEQAVKFEFLGGYMRTGALHLEAHNFLIDMWAELGILTVILFCVFYVYVAWAAIRGGGLAAALFFFVTIGYVFLSGLSDWSFWFTVGIIFNCLRQARAVEGAARRRPALPALGPARWRPQGGVATAREGGAA